jgi:putative membrane protein
MFDRLPKAAIVFALLAAAIHVLFFVLESVLFRRPFAWRTFGIRTQQDAETTRDWALNQGFYNMFLAVSVVVGVLLQLSSNAAAVSAGVGMVLLGTASMVGAALVLLVTKPALLRGVAIQGVAPLLAILSVLIF